MSQSEASYQLPEEEERALANQVYDINIDIAPNQVYDVNVNVAPAWWASQGVTIVWHPDVVAHVPAPGQFGRKIVLPPGLTLRESGGSPLLLLVHALRGHPEVQAIRTPVLSQYEYWTMFGMGLCLVQLPDGCGWWIDLVFDFGVTGWRGYVPRPFWERSWTPRPEEVANLIVPRTGIEPYDPDLDFF